MEGKQMSQVEKKTKKLWDKGSRLNMEIEKFTAGNDPVLDQKLIQYDCIASIAHVEMLGKIGILNQKETAAIKKELQTIIKKDKRGDFKISLEEEDCHTAIENHLISRLGDTGKKIHTFRSRNDQVSTALRLFYKNELSECENLIDMLIFTLHTFQKKYQNVKIPGFTHTRKAMPSSIDLWVKAIIDAMMDNRRILDSTIYLIDQSPLGSGAGYGISFDTNREYTAERMGFTRIQHNPIYVQNSRGKFEANILHTLSLIMFEINKASSDLIIFSMPEFGFFVFPDEFLTGSSMMPHKKNPDVLELLRTNYHLIVSYEFQVKNIIANLISGYHRDFQQTKEPVFKGFEITQKSLQILNHIFRNLGVNKRNCKKAMTDELFVTERVFQLLKQGMPFRDAYRTIADEFASKKKSNKKKF